MSDLIDTSLMNLLDEWVLSASVLKHTYVRRGASQYAIGGIEELQKAIM